MAALHSFEQVKGGVSGLGGRALHSQVGERVAAGLTLGGAIDLFSLIFLVLT